MTAEPSQLPHPQLLNCGGSQSTAKLLLTWGAHSYVTFLQPAPVLAQRSPSDEHMAFQTFHFYPDGCDHGVDLHGDLPRGSQDQDLRGQGLKGSSKPQDGAESQAQRRGDLKPGVSRLSTPHPPKESDSLS